MAKPTPDDFQALIPTPSSTMCGAFVQTLLRLPLVLWQYITAIEAPGGGTLASTQRTGDLAFSAAPSATDGTRLLCDGSEVPKTVYANLYTAIGDTWGTAVSSSNFKLPDFRARFPVGVGNFTNQGAVTLGTAGGEDQQKLTEANLPLFDTGGLAASNGTDHVWTAVSATGPTKNGPGIGADPVQNAPEIVNTKATYGTTTPTAVPTLPPFAPCYIYIIT